MTKGSCGRQWRCNCSAAAAIRPRGTQQATLPRRMHVVPRPSLNPRAMHPGASPHQAALVRLEARQHLGHVGLHGAVRRLVGVRAVRAHACEDGGGAHARTASKQCARRRREQRSRSCRACASARRSTALQRLRSSTAGAAAPSTSLAAEPRQSLKLTSSPPRPHTPGGGWSDMTSSTLWWWCECGPPAYPAAEDPLRPRCVAPAHHHNGHTTTTHGGQQPSRAPGAQGEAAAAALGWAGEAAPLLSRETLLSLARGSLARGLAALWNSKEMEREGRSITCADELCRLVVGQLGVQVRVLLQQACHLLAVLACRLRAHACTRHHPCSLVTTTAVTVSCRNCSPRNCDASAAASAPAGSGLASGGCRGALHSTTRDAKHCARCRLLSPTRPPSPAWPCP